MTTTPRNAPCPCGSGKKFKKCHGVEAPPALGPERFARPPKAGPRSFFPSHLDEPHDYCPSCAKQLGRDVHGHFLDDDLDVVSNSVVDLVDERRFDEALAACKRLLEEWPDVVDGLERSALVHSALGDHAEAADFYRRALAFVTDPSRAADYEDADFFREKLESESRLAASPAVIDQTPVAEKEPAR